jgi:hypothetical protein
MSSPIFGEKWGASLAIPHLGKSNSVIKSGEQRNSHFYYPLLRLTVGGADIYHWTSKLNLAMCKGLTRITPDYQIRIVPLPSCPEGI